MKAVRYTADAAKDLRRHRNMAERVRKAFREYAENPAAHANNVTKLVNQPGKRMTIGDFRAIFTEDKTEIAVIKVAPRGSAYND